MKHNSLRPVSIILFCIFIFTAWIDPFNDKVSEGNRNYNDGKFNEALNSYREAEKYVPDDKKRSMLEFNKGNAEFKINNHESALGKYRNSLNSGDPDVQKKALYNAGTTYMKMGKKKEAAENFIKAIQIDPSYAKNQRIISSRMKMTTAEETGSRTPAPARKKMNRKKMIIRRAAPRLKICWNL